MKKISFQQQVLTGFAFSILVVLAINYFAFSSIMKLNENAGAVNHTQEVLNKGNDLYVLLLNSETGQRGYVITGEDRYLDIYRKSVNSVDDAMKSLSALITDNPKQVVTTDSIKHYVVEKLDEMQLVINLRREAGFEKARQRVLTDKGKNLMESLRTHIRILFQEESRLLKLREAETEKSTQQSYIIIVLGFVVVMGILLYMFFNITRTFRLQREAEAEIKKKNIELGIITDENIRKNWLLTGSAQLNEKIRGEHAVNDLSDHIIKSVAGYLNARMAALYLYDRTSNELILCGTYSYGIHQSNARAVKPGEGLLGQAALDKNIIVYNNIPDDYVKIQSGLGNTVPKNVLIAPVYSGSKMQAVLELGFTEDIDQSFLDYLEFISENVAIAIQSAKAREVMQQQSEELQAQQEELQQTNEELISQTNLLQASEEELRVQQEELQQTNVELEEKAAQLEEKNQAVEEARTAITQKALELEQTNKYKSEFLANMSHELRTPLNSILILAKLLSENKAKNLSEGDVKYASVIYNSGNDLLTLINDILDLSKIESGKLDMNFEDASIADICEDMDNMFRHVADNKKINFNIDVARDVKSILGTDKQRLEQVLRNLLSNAFKFTSQGGNISLSFTNSNDKLAMHVKDSGIGIPLDKQRLIFEAFQQADGTTSRKYGGTGLGLSISRELASLLGGEITLYSKQGEGSTFTLTIPYEYAGTSENSTDSTTRPDQYPQAMQKVTGELDRVFNTASDSNCILIVEDDTSFASILKDYANTKGYETIVAHDGEEGLKLAREHKPRAILLDIMLPIMNGWDVLKAIKNDDSLRHIPVHIMSANEQYGAQAQTNGALSFVEKPVSTNTLEQLFLSIGSLFDHSTEGPDLKKVLIIEDNELESAQLKEILVQHAMTATQAFTGKQGLDVLDTQKFDCVILDLKLPDMDGLEVLREIKSKNELRNLPVIINTAMDIPQHIQSEIIKFSNAFIIKNKRSNERLMDEIRLFMNKIVQDEAQYKSASLSQAKASADVSKVNIEKALKGKKVLVADDDMRNVFALTSILQQYDLVVEIANNGVEALDKLKVNPDTDIVLMDIMMPEMDGYEAMRQIRSIPKFKDLPMIALTAKAMKNDREKCLEAGANDYLPKPVDTDKLLSLMRVWLSR